MSDNMNVVLDKISYWVYVVSSVFFLVSANSLAILTNITAQDISAIIAVYIKGFLILSFSFSAYGAVLLTSLFKSSKETLMKYHRFSAFHFASICIFSVFELMFCLSWFFLIA